MYARISLLSLVLLLAAMTGHATAQSPTTGALEGLVVDPTGAPLVDVQVTITPVTGGATRRAVTSRGGRFQVLLVPPGNYDVLVERLGLQPVRYTGVPVRARRSAHVRAVLETATGEVMAARDVAFTGASGVSLPGTSEVMDAAVLPMIQDRRFDPAELLRLSSRGDADLSMEGLPPGFTTVTIDGLLFRAARHPGMPDGMLAALAHSLGGLQQAEVFGGSADVQGPALGGGVLALTTKPGGGAQQGRVLATGSVFGDELPDDFLELRGAADVGASLLGDSAQVRLSASYAGAEAQTLRWPTPADQEALDALFAAGLAVPAAGGAFAAEDTRLNLGGRFDWLLGDDQALGVSALFARADGTGIGTADGTLRAAPYTATDLLLGASYNARLGQSFGARVQAGFGNSRRELEEGGGVAALVAAPRVAVDDGLFPAGAAERTDVQVQVAGMVQVDTHLFELGVGGLFTSHEIATGFARDGLFHFGDVADVDARMGSFLRMTGPAPLADFTTRELYVFAQDRWTIVPGFDLRTSGRVSTTSLPGDDIVPASDWRTLTGLDNTAAPTSITGYGVSGGFDWNVQLRNRWIVRADITMQSGEIAPALLAEALTVDARSSVERFTGEMTDLPGAPVAPSTLRLTVLDDEIEAPVTTRASFGFAAEVTPGTSVLLGGAIRRTTGLPRRVDLNLLPEPAATDQYGRNVYGTLEQAGGVLAPASGTGRRFADYDVVSGIESDATSTYWGVSVGLERRVGSDLDLFASYTYSDAIDELPAGTAAAAHGAITPISALAPTDWHDGTSDYDVPHRLGLGATMRLPLERRVVAGGMFTYASGRPFTPGFAPGIDANGDGVFGNDPAFVDPELEGMDALLSTWDCLRSSAGRFADRNVCRAPARKALDLRLEAAVLDGPVGVDLLVEALDLLADAAIGHDAALYRLDTDATAELDPADGEITVPLIVNPAFGEPLPTILDPARVRVGLRLRF